MTTPVSSPTVIDAHVHLWDLAVWPQTWTEDLPPLRRSVIEHVLAAFGPDRTGGTSARWYSLSGIGDALGQNGSGS